MTDPLDALKNRNESGEKSRLSLLVTNLLCGIGWPDLQGSLNSGVDFCELVEIDDDIPVYSEPSRV